jgi:hypothetical protein
MLAFVRLHQYRLCSNGHVSLTGFTSFIPLLTRHCIMSKIEIPALKRTNRGMITASMDIDRFIIQLSTLMAEGKSSETNWHTRHVATMITIITSTGRDYSIRPIRESEYHCDIVSNIIDTSQSSAISSPRSYTGRDASPQ